MAKVFNAGDKVKCIDCAGSYFTTVGKEYVITGRCGYGEELVSFIGDHGKEACAYDMRFELAPLLPSQFFIRGITTENKLWLESQGIRINSKNIGYEDTGYVVYNYGEENGISATPHPVHKLKTYVEILLTNVKTSVTADWEVVEQKELVEFNGKKYDKASVEKALQLLTQEE